MGKKHQRLWPEMRAFQAEVPSGSMWMPVPDLTKNREKELQSKLMLISKSDEARKEVETYVATLVACSRIERGIKKLFDAGCNLTRRMCVIVYCSPERRRKVKLFVDEIFVIVFAIFKVEVDFDAGGLIFGEGNIDIELELLSRFIGNGLN